MAAKKRSASGSSADRAERTGVIAEGNINLSNRKPVKFGDSVATVRSISFSDRPGVEILIPTVVGGRVVSDQKAIDHYYKTGKHLGKYTTVSAAQRAAERIHQAEQARLRRNRNGR